jgi:hypothetical protein
MNQAIEFHDSSLTRVSRVASGIEFELEAYVHRSSGKPAVDPGEGWAIPCKIALLSTFEVSGNVHEAGSIWDGSVSIPGRAPESVLALPLHHEGRCAIELVLTSGEIIRVSGSGLEVTPTGSGSFIEMFSGGA